MSIYNQEVLKMSKKLTVNLPELLKQKNMSLRELSRKTGIRHAALSELSHLKRSSINVNHLLAIINELEINDIREIIDIVEEDEETA
jgi:putative transcriptional regulator